MEVSQENDYELLYMYHQQYDIALRLLIQKYHRMICSLVVHRTRSRDTALKDELYQLAMIKLPLAIDSYRMEKHVDFGAFYIGIVKRSMQDYLKKQQRYQQNQDDYTQMLGFEVCEESGRYITRCDHSISSSQEEMEATLMELLKRYDVSLKPKEYRILHLRLLGFSYREIAAKLHTSLYMVDYLIRRLRYKKDRID